MKLLKIPVLLLLLLSPFTDFGQQMVKFEKTYTEVCFSNNQTIQELAEAQKVLSGKGIHLIYDNLKFGKDGKLTSLEYHVTTGKAGATDKSYETTFAIGFIINYDPQWKYDIIAGTKKQIEKKRIEFEKKN